MRENYNNIYELLGAQSEVENDSISLHAQYNRNTVSREICAFSNTNGGTIIIGCQDDGIIIGIKEGEYESIFNDIDQLIRTLSLKIRPHIMIFNDYRLIRIDVVKSDKPLVSIDGRFYIRKGDMNYVMSPFERMDLLTRRDVKSLLPLKCFVAMSFRFEEVPHLEDYYDAITRTIEKSNLEIELVRVDRSTKDIDVVTQIKEGIKSADIMISDFTESSHNVYYETGLANAYGVETIYLAERGTRIHFDLEHMNFQFYRNAHELEEKLHDPIVNAFNTVMQKKKNQ